MANNGYLVDGVCSPSYASIVYNKCLAVAPPGTLARVGVFTDSSGIPRIMAGSNNLVCYNASISNVGYAYFDFKPNCEIGLDPSSIKIPTVADGIALGWQAGSALILVGCILFLKKALK